MIYLDNAATTPVKSQVVDVIIEVLRNNYGNPSSIYEYGFESHRLLESSRTTIANFINANPEEIIFTSGACESNTTIVKGMSFNNPIITTPIEHISTLKALEDIGYDYEDNIVKVDQSGLIDLQDLEYKLEKNKLRDDFVPVFMCVLGNNEIGTVQDICKIQEIVHKHGAYMAVDATQYIPYYPIDVKKMHIDMLSFSGQKLGAPKGIGVLYVRDGIKIKSLICGSQNNGRRGGTENVAYCVGLAKAIELINYNKTSEIKKLRDYCLDELNQLSKNMNLKFVLNGDREKRLANNINIQMPYLDSQQLVALLDLNNICVSASSACQSYEKKPSHVLKAIKLSDMECNSSIRVTLGENTTKEEIDEFVKQIKIILEQFI